MTNPQRRVPLIEPRRVAPLRKVSSLNERDQVLRYRQKALLIGSLILQDVKPLTAKYMGYIYEGFMSSDTLTLSEMAEGLGVRPEALRSHVTTLTDMGYLTRVHHRAWELGTKLQDL